MTINEPFIQRIWDSHSKCRTEMQKRFDYYDGNHTFLQSLTLRQQNKSNVAVNFLDYMIDSHVALTTGLPYEYVADNEDDPAIPNLEQVVKSNSLPEIDSEHFLTSLIAGYSVELHSFNEDGIKVTAYDPREFAFVFEHDGETIHLAIHKAKLAENSVFNGRFIEQEEYLFTVYTQEEIHTYHQTKAGMSLIESTPHYYGQVPVVIFTTDERKKPFLNLNLIEQNDLYNRVVNSRMDELEYKNAILAAVGFANTSENANSLANVNARCTVSRRTQSTNAKNQQTYGSYAQLATNVPCRLITKTRTAFHDDKWITIEDSILYFRFGQDIERDDSISIGGRTFKVETVISNPGNASHHIEATVKEII